MPRTTINTARTLASTRTQVGNVTGTGILFNGSTTKVTVQSNSAFQGLSQMSISFWMKAQSVGGVFRKILYKNGVFDVGLTNNGTLFGEYNGIHNFGTIDGGPHDDDAWKHVCITYNGSTAKWYVDGTEKETASATGSIGTSSDALYFGNNGGTEWFKGILDDVRIYSTGLTATQVTILYNKQVLSVDPVGWWKLDEAEGTVARDSATANNTGTITDGSFIAGTINRTQPRKLV